MAKKNKVASLVKVASDPGPVSASSYKPSAEDKLRQRKYAAEDALRTLTRATEIQKDKTLMRDVCTMAKQQIKDLSSVTKRKPSGR